MYTNNCAEKQSEIGVRNRATGVCAAGSAQDKQRRLEKPALQEKWCLSWDCGGEHDFSRC